MSAREQINGNSKNQDRDAPVQIIQKSEAIRRGMTAEYLKRFEPDPDLGYTGDQWDAASHYALGGASVILEFITSPNRDHREWAKKEIKRLEKLGREVIEAEQNPTPCKHPALAQHGKDEDGADLLRCLECGAIGSRSELTK